MAVLSDKDIKKYLKKGELILGKINQEQISPAWIELTLDNKFKAFKFSEITHLDVRKKIPEDLLHSYELEEGKPFIIHPNDFVLACTKEYIKMPDDLMARLDGRSTLGRLGVVVHSTAGGIDPGFEGQLTLEISNHAKIPITLWPGMKICKIIFEQLSTKADTPYYKRKDAKYLKQKGPTDSKSYKDYE